MTEFIPTEKGVPIRNPSTALLLIDSTDRFSTPGLPTQPVNNIIFNKSSSLVNGFFTRIAVAEIVLDWCVENVSAIAGNDEMIFGIPGFNSNDPFSVIIPDGQYTVETLLDQLITSANDAIDNITSPAPYVFSLIDINGKKALHLESSPGGVATDFDYGATNLSEMLDLTSPGELDNDLVILCPKILPYTYIDFVSNQLTYNQELKDTTTNLVERNVLYRWYFAWDEQPTLDGYGYPIFQGYTSFITRRVPPFPKQIRWTPNQPIGQISIQLYSSQGTLLDEGLNEDVEYAITCLVSEV